MREYVDFRIEMSAPGADRVHVHASCQDGETRSVAEVRTEDIGMARLHTLTGDQNLGPQEKLRLASELGRLLAPGEVRELLRSVFAAAGPDSGIRLRLVLRDPELMTLPWEYAYVPLSDNEHRLSPYLALHPAVSIIRHHANPVAAPSLLHPPGVPFRILATSARALPGMRPLLAEQAGVPDAGLLNGEGLRFEVTRCADPVTAPMLERELTAKFDLFHFTGHAVGRTRLDGSTVVLLAVGDGAGGVRLLEPDRLATSLVEAGVRIVFVNACNPGTRETNRRMAVADAFVEAGMPAAIVMQAEIEDSHAAAFGEGFYTALAAGLSLDESISLGRRRMHELGILTSWGAPVGYCRSPDGLIFTPAPPVPEDGAVRLSGRMLAYRSGREHLLPGPIEPAVHEAIDTFRGAWQPPEERDERAEINTVTTAGLPDPGNDHRAHDLLRVLAACYPQGVGERQLVETLGLPGRAELQQARQHAKQLLLERRDGQLSQFQVQTFPGGDGGERKYQLVRLPIAILLERSPDAHSGLNRELRLAMSLYDLGWYAESVSQIASMLPAVAAQTGMLTVPEHALLFYYLSKSLLKLNWYDELNTVLEGPYLELSRSTLKDLEVERLQVAGQRFRQLGDLAAAQTCLDGAVEILDWMSRTMPSEPVLLRGFSDGHVLRAQIRLDQVVDTGNPAAVRTAALTTARNALQSAHAYAQRLRKITRAGTHYEGRLHGTRAFLGIATSMLEPGAVDASSWQEWEDMARQGFEPARERKPFGVVAGKYALSVVFLAKARWHSTVPGGSEPAARAAVREADVLLRSLFEEFLEPAKVLVGAKFEMPKLRLAADTAAELLRATSWDAALWERVQARRAIWSPLV